MFSETRYALNGDLRVAYRASAEGERDNLFEGPPNSRRLTASYGKP